MYLKPVKIDKWKIYAIRSGRGDCPLLEFLEGLDQAYDENVARLISDFDTIAKHSQGPQALPDKRCHTIAPDIWQLTVGRLRVAWFYDDGKMMVCSHGFFKDSQETKKADKKRALKAHKDYFEAKKENNLVYDKEEEED